MPNKPIEWEKEFNKKWKNLEGLYFAFVGANKEAKADMKAFISLQRQELVEELLEKVQEIVLTNSQEIYQSEGTSFLAANTDKIMLDFYELQKKYLK